MKRLVLLALTLAACSGGVKSGTQTIPLVTPEYHGQMRKEDKVKLDSFQPTTSVDGLAGGTLTSDVTAPSFTSTAASGQDAFAVQTQGARLRVGTNSNDFFYGAAAGIYTPAGLYVGGLVASDIVRPYNTGSILVRGMSTDGASAIGVRIGNQNALTTSGAKIAAFYSDNGTTERAWIDKDGHIRGGTGYLNGVMPWAAGTSLDLQGTALNSSNAVGVVINNTQTLSTVGAKILSIRNNGTEVANIDRNGTYWVTGGGFVNTLLVTTNHVTTPLQLRGDVTNAANAVAVRINTLNNYTTAGAKILSVQNAGVEKAFVDKDGTLQLSGNVQSEDMSSRVRRLSVLPAGYVEQEPINFRFDQDALRYVNRWGGSVTITAAAFTADDLDRVFSLYASFLNLNGKADGASIEVTGISIASSANNYFWPFVFMHNNAGAASPRVVMEVMKSGAPGTWETAFDGVVDTYRVAQYISATGNLTGVRWTFHNAQSPGSPFSTNIYVRALGAINRNSAGYAWTVMKGGDTMYGDLTLANNARIIGAPMDLATFYAGKPANGALMYRVVAASTYRLPASLTGSRFFIGTNPTTSALVLSVRKNGTQFCTLSISTAGVFTPTSCTQTDFAAGDRLEVFNAATANAAAADFSITFLGSRL
jgi:hypothetical protein